jgi:predicted nuclease of predicted toxin-antitoxin system
VLSRAISFVVDENVDIAVGEFLEQRGHHVLFVAQHFASGISDDMIAILGNVYSAVVVTHDKDFKALARRVPEGNRQRFRKLGRISLRCREPQARRRIEDVIESIEFEYEQAQHRNDKRLIFDISTTTFTVTR